MRRRRTSGGNAMVEFTMVCVPLIFVLISVVELARFMWSYHTLVFAMEKGARFAVVHGQGCAAASASCPVSVGTVALVIKQAATGLDAGQMNVTLQSASASRSCAPLSSCLSTSDIWPPADDNGVGLPIKISGTYPFRTAMAMFWPGSKPVRVGAVNMGATAKEEIRF